jgi:hypothetical protein
MKTAALRLAASIGLALTGTLLGSLSACAQGGGTTPVRGLRVVVTASAEVAAVDEFTRRVAQASGVSARDAVHVGDGRRTLAVTLECSDDAACQRAYERLEAARDWVAELRRDERRGLPRPVKP